MKTGSEGLALIKRFEGFSAKAYLLPGERYYTIGYGHSFDTSITADTVWTREQAETQLRKELEQFENYVNKDVPIRLNQNQFDALVSYSYNRGRGGLRQLVQNSRTAEEYAANLVVYWGSAVRYKTGLLNRRRAEQKLFRTPVPDGGSFPREVEQFQRQLNASYGAKLTADGCFGPLTRKAAVLGIQIELNEEGAGLVPDGIAGEKTHAALSGAVLRRGHRGNLVYLMQGLLYGGGYDPKGLDGVFGGSTLDAVVEFQGDHGLTVDGIVGGKTWRALLN